MEGKKRHELRFKQHLLIRKVYPVLFSLFFILPVAFPQATGWVNDFAHMMDSRSAGQINQALSEFNKETSIEISVVTIDSIGSYGSIESYANELFRAWHFGKKGKDNGVLILVAKKEKKVRIEVGYGLESILPDGLTGEIIRKQILPSFKKKAFGEGIALAVNQIIKTLQQKQNKY
jgi:uncharacterized protein